MSSGAGNKRVSDIKRAQRESLLNKKLASLISTISLDDPRVAGIMLNRVQLSPDKGVATLYFYIPGGPEAFREKLEVLILYKPSIRSALSKLVPSRYTPDLVFKYDAQFEKEMHINQLLDTLKDEQ